MYIYKCIHEESFHLTDPHNLKYDNYNISSPYHKEHTHDVYLSLGK